jgi:hypothetical protein
MSSGAVRSLPFQSADYDRQDPRDRARLRVLDAAVDHDAVQVGHQFTAHAMAEAIRRIEEERPAKASRCLEIANQEIDRIVWLDTGVSARLDLGKQLARIDWCAFSLALWVNALELVAVEDRDVDYECGDDPDAVARAEVRRIATIARRLGEAMPARLPRRSR